MSESDGIWLIVALAFIFVAWYIIGAQWQQRVRARYIRTLGETAQLLSESRTMPRVRWLGQAGFQLVVDDAVAPYTKLSIVAFLMPRESILLLVAALLRRRGDSVVMRADLRQRPSAASTASAKEPFTQRSFSRESPNVIASLDPAWTREHAPAELAAVLRGAVS